MSIHTATKGEKNRRNCFAVRQIQISVALLIVISLLGGIFLQSISSMLSTTMGLSVPVVILFLVIGYSLIIIFLAMRFSHKLVGPFHRLEYEMKTIAKGNINRRLSIKNQDDLHVRNFVASVNKCIGELEGMSQEYNEFSGFILSQLDDIVKKMKEGETDCQSLKEQIRAVQHQAQHLRERW